jgi:hypothetical protein
LFNKRSIVEDFASYNDQYSLLAQLAFMLTQELLSDPTLGGSVLAHDGDLDGPEYLETRFDRLDSKEGNPSH